jgi:MFS family permease
MDSVFALPHRMANSGISRGRLFARRFSKDYWTFFAAAFCMDLGFGLFFFLFNLYLTDLSFNERTIGHVMACLTLGNVAGTIPATVIARRYGMGPLLSIAFLCAPVLCALRVMVLWEPAQYGLAFATGMALCGWPICFSPTIAKLTREDNRSIGFSIAFATGIGLGTLSGLAGGYIPELLHMSPLHTPLIHGIRVVLLLACVIVLLGIWPLRRITAELRAAPARLSTRLFHPYLIRFLPAFMLWSVVAGSFPLFGAVYLQKALGLPLGRLGAVFSASQLAQFCAVLLAPLLLKRLGIAKGVAAIQIGTAAFLLLISATRIASIGVCFYVLYFAMQYMCGPGIYNLLMNNVAEAERSTASAVQNIAGALCQAGSAAVTGICIVTFGYHDLLIANACAAVLASLLFLMLGMHRRKRLNADEKWIDASTPETIARCMEA